MLKNTITKFFLTIVIGLTCSQSWAQDSNESTIKEIGIFEKLGSTPNLHISLWNEDGASYDLGEALDSSLPTVIQFGYFTCPLLCGLVSDGILEVVNGCSLELGQDYQIVSISISQFDTPATTAAYSKKYSGLLDKRHNKDAWLYFSKDKTERVSTLNESLGAPRSIKQFATEIGFNYKFIKETNDYAHSAGLIILSPSGMVTRYLYGAQFSEFDFKMAIIEAKDDVVRSSVERVLLFCYTYDPQKRGYSIQAMKVMRVGAAFFLVLLLFGIIKLVKRRKE